MHVRNRAAALLYFTAPFLVFPSGRFASADAGRQLRVALLLSPGGEAGLAASAGRRDPS